MKKITFIIVSLLLISCSEMKDLSMIKDVENISLCLLSADVYNAESQQKTKEYLERREVLRKIELKGEQRESFVEEFLNENNYEVVSRKCKFEPVYALLVNGKPYAFFDVEYCPTLKIMVEGKEPKYMDIATENTLKKLLDAYTKIVLRKIPASFFAQTNLLISQKKQRSREIL